MLNTAMHRPRLRMLACILGELIAAFSLNYFIVPLGLYSGGSMGVCQLIRTLLQIWGGLSFGDYDIAGILYFLSNIPILLYARGILGRKFVLKTVVCTMAFSLFYSVIPAPSTMVVNDTLTACLLGGILTGVGSGLVLTCGGSGGGLDVIGLCLSKKGSRFTVGRFSMTFNAFLYALCLILFTPETAIYSVIYNFASAMVVDKAHQQNISVQALIFTRAGERELGRVIMDELGRGVTWWEGVGAYTGENVHVLCVCLSKYEIEELFHTVHEMDPHAFITLQEGVRIYGNFQKKLE
ncbi:YitT family protein [uncultured Dysosmobacter sp.]|uniref:YitT family protein n=1 Tax=uncultured Dysosmobacter sp. TaxID=2591384 RepID=UPI0025CE07C7|nr:YitT family protein [uncultured Dysosmobacter sp.]